MLIMPPNGSSSTSFSSSSSSSTTNGNTTHFESSFTGPDGRTIRQSSRQPGPVLIENGVARLVDPRTASGIVARAQAQAGAGFFGPSPELLNMSLPALIQAQLLSANALAGQGVPPALVQQFLLQQQLMGAQGGGPGILL
jgi:hypothetical protein